MNASARVVVVGAGPAGIAAARTASDHAPTILLDEAAEMGGHLRLGSHEHGPEDLSIPDAVDYRAGASVWGLFAGPTVAVTHHGRAETIAAGAVVVATGTVDRVWPVAGWELPGVLTPSELLDALRRGDLGTETRIGAIGLPDALDALRSRLEQHNVAVTASVPLTPNVRIEGERHANRIVADGEAHAVDAIVIAAGSVPEARLALLARPESNFGRGVLTELPLLDTSGRTSVPGVLVTGGAAGISGLDAIRTHGTRTGRSAAASVTGGSDNEGGPRMLPGTAAALPPLPSDNTTQAHRTQAVTIRELRSAIADGAWDVNDLRRRTRAGMGPGGEALPVLAALLLEHDPQIEPARLMARVRPPLRPVPFASVLASGEERSA